MIEIIYNNEKTTVDAPLTILEYLTKFNICIGYGLIILNDQVIESDHYDKIKLSNYDQIALVQPLQGG